MLSINSHYNVEPGTDFAMGVGGYVRMKGTDLGTGQVITRSRAECLLDDGMVVEQIIYTVHWLDQKDPSGERTVFRPAAQADLVTSARGVQSFKSPEEAEAWMEKQMDTGNWTDKVQDAADSTSDVDVALAKILEEGK